MFAEYDEVLNTDEACEALKIGLSTLYKLLKAGKDSNAVVQGKSPK